jgi:TetR/AcrR family transcriptional regulator, transcriptional repressor for nem operon
MARKKEFNPDKALTKALNLFWLNGYAATSVDVLCIEMGIKRGSMYDTFGNKHSLFTKSLNQYVMTMYANASFVFQYDSAIEAITEMFKFFAEESINDLDRKGCFLVNSIAELSATDIEIRKYSIDQYKKFEQFFYSLLLKAEENGEIEPGQNLNWSANYLVNSFFGLRVTGKVNPDRKILEGIITKTISML